MQKERSWEEGGRSTVLAFMKERSNRKEGHAEEAGREEEAVGGKPLSTAGGWRRIGGRQKGSLRCRRCVICCPSR